MTNNLNSERGPFKIAVIGGGIAGLSAAYKLNELAAVSDTPLECTVFEAGNRVGGVIESRMLNGYLLELGPDSFITTKPWGMDLVRRLGLEDEIQHTNTTFRRTFVARGNTLYPLPQGFRLMAPTDIPSFLTSPVLSWLGKFRLLMDLFIPARESQNDETIAEFARRRLGNEALESIVQPMLGGMYMGDVELLSLQATMPQFSLLESKYGGVIKGLQAEKTDDHLSHGGVVGAGVRYGMFVSFKRGMQTMVDALVSKLPLASIVLNAPIKGISRVWDQSDPEDTPGTYKLAMVGGSRSEFDAVILAVPAHQASKLTETLEPELSRQLQNIDYSSSAVLNLAYRREQIPHELNGFGFVVPQKERRSIFACTFESIKFPGRCPEGTVMLRVYMSGSLLSHLVELNDDQLKESAAKDLKDLLGITQEPVFFDVCRYKNAMPQYNIGHQKCVQRIMEELDRLPGLMVAGNAYHGVGIPDCINSGEIAAAEIHAYLTEEE